MGNSQCRLFSAIVMQVVFACREYACSAVDVLARRLRLAFLNVHAAEEALPRVIEIMARELGWNAQRQQACILCLCLSAPFVFFLAVCEFS